jgi:hypothetical protein
MKRTGQLSIAVLLSLLCAVTALAAPAFERAAPENAVALIAVRSVPELKADLAASVWNDLWREPSVQAFMEKPRERLHEMLAEQEGKVGFTSADVLGLFQGQAAFMVWGDGKPNSTEEGVVFLAEIGEQGDKAIEIIKGICNAAAQEAGEAAPTFVEENYNGARLLSVHPAVEAGMEADEGDAVVFGVSGDVLLMGGPMAGVKRMVDSLSALPAVSLADNASYQAVVRKVSPDSNVYGFVNVAGLIAVLQAAAQEGAATAAASMGAPAPDMSQFAAIVEALGLDNVDSAGFGIQTNQEYGAFTGFLRVVGEPHGIPKILMPGPGPLHTGAEAPSTADSFFSARFSAAPVWDELQRVVAGINPGIMTMVNAQLDQLAQRLGEPFDLRNDVLAMIGPRVAAYSWYEKPYNVSTSRQMVFVIDISSKAAFDAAYQKLQRLFPDQLALFQPEEYMGHTLYKMQMPMMSGMENMPQGEMPEMPAFAVTDKDLIVSQRASAVQAHLRRLNGEGESLADLPAYQEVMAQLPTDGRILFSYSDGRESVEYGLTVLREGQLDMILGMIASDPDVAEVLGLFDFQDLPPAEDVIRHLSPSGCAATVDADGLTFVSKIRMRARAE